MNNQDKIKLFDRLEALRIKYRMQLPEEKPYQGAWADYSNEPHFLKLLPMRQADAKHQRESIFRQLDRIRLITEIIQAKSAYGGANLDMSKLEHERWILEFYALHDKVLPLELILRCR